MKNSKRNIANQKQRAAKARAGKPSGNSKYGRKYRNRRKGIPNPNSPIQIIKIKGIDNELDAA